MFRHRVVRQKKQKKKNMKQRQLCDCLEKLADYNAESFFRMTKKIDKIKVKRKNGERHSRCFVDALRIAVSRRPFSFRQNTGDDVISAFAFRHFAVASRI